MINVRHKVMREGENRLDLGNRHAVLLALCEIAIIPIKT
jgi:hypothetical protein